MLLANKKSILKLICASKCLITVNEKRSFLWSYIHRILQVASIYSIHLSLRVEFYDRTTRSRSRNREERFSERMEKTSIGICFHSLQKSCLPRVAWYTQLVTCFAGCNNFPCSNRCESCSVLSYHSSMTFQFIKYTRELRDRRFSRYTDIHHYDREPNKNKGRE